MSCWLLPSAQGACGALCCRSAAARLGRAAPTRSPTSARRVRPHRRLPRRRTLHYALAGTVFGPAGPPLAPGADPAATAVPQTPLPARLPEPVPRGRRLDLLAAVLPHRLGPARAAPDHPGPSWCAAPAPRRLSSSTTRCWQSWPATRVLRCRKLRMDTTVVEADIDHPTDADLLEHAVRTLGGLVRRVQAARRGHPYPVPRPLPRRRAAALADLPDPAAAHRAGPRPDRPAHRPDRPAHLAQAERIARNPRRALGRRPGDGRLQRLVCQLEETTAATHRLLDQTRQRLRGTRVIPDRLISLADPDARPIRKGKPHKPTEFGYTVLLAECERGFIATHHTHQGNPSDAAQLIPALTQVMAVTSRPPGTVTRGSRVWHRRQRPGVIGVGRQAGRAATRGQARQGPGRLRADPSVQTDAQLAGRDRSPHQPAQTLLRAAAHPAAPPCRRADLGGAGDLRLQPAADDGGRRINDHPGGVPPPPQSSIIPYQDFFSGK